MSECDVYRRLILTSKDNLPAEKAKYAKAPRCSDIIKSVQKSTFVSITNAINRSINKAVTRLTKAYDFSFHVVSNKPSNGDHSYNQIQTEPIIFCHITRPPITAATLHNGGNRVRVQCSLRGQKAVAAYL